MCYIYTCDPSLKESAKPDDYTTLDSLHTSKEEKESSTIRQYPYDFKYRVPSDSNVEPIVSNILDVLDSGRVS